MLFNCQFVHIPGSSLQQDVGELYMIITQGNREISELITDQNTAHAMNIMND